MKNNEGFSLLEIIITISLAGILLAIMGRTIKTGLEVQSFLKNKNAAINWTESVLEAYKNKAELNPGVKDSNNNFIRQLEILESKSLPKNYKLTTVEIKPYQKNGINYQSLYRLKIVVDFKCKDKEYQNELLSLIYK